MKSLFSQPSQIDDESAQQKKARTGLIAAGAFGISGLVVIVLATPFLAPALRKHCLPYVPATDLQLNNLSRAFKRHATKGGSFLDIGSGDGRICRLAARSGLFSQTHGVELNFLLVLFSRIMAIKSGQFRSSRYFHNDLWKFPLSQYDAICIFGVDSMMQPLEKCLKKSNFKAQTVFACRFHFDNMKLVDEIGEGIDTVWVYKLDENRN